MSPADAFGEYIKLVNIINKQLYNILRGVCIQHYKTGTSDQKDYKKRVKATVRTLFIHYMRHRIP